jgi:hypothetical protein
MFFSSFSQLYIRTLIYGMGIAVLTACRFARLFAPYLLRHNISVKRS